MHYVVTGLIILVSILLVLVVLVQNSKGGGFASGFSAPGQMMGARRSADFLEKATWSLAIGLLVLSLASSMLISRGATERTTALKDQINNTMAEPAAPVATPSSQNEAQPKPAPAE